MYSTVGILPEGLVMTCCWGERKNSVSHSSMDEADEENQVVRNTCNGHLAGVHPGSGVDINNKKRNCNSLEEPAEDTQHGRKGEKKSKKDVDHTTNNNDKRQITPALQPMQNNKCDVAGAHKKVEMKTGHTTHNDSYQEQIERPSVFSQAVHNHQTDVTVDHEMEITSTKASQTDDREMKTLADVPQSFKGQGEIADVHLRLKMGPDGTTPLSRNTMPTAISLALEPAQNHADQSKIEMKAVIPRTSQSQGLRIHFMRQLEQKMFEPMPIANRTARDDQIYLPGFQQTYQIVCGQTNLSHTGHNEAAARAVALCGPAAVQTTTDMSTIPRDHTVTIQEFDRPITNEHGEQVMVKGRRTVVEHLGAHKKVGRKKYYVRKQQSQVGTCRDWFSGNQAKQASQDSYFGSDTEDEDEKEYLKTAAEDLDMNW